MSVCVYVRAFHNKALKSEANETHFDSPWCEIQEEFISRENRQRAGLAYTIAINPRAVATTVERETPTSRERELI